MEGHALTKFLIEAGIHENPMRHMGFESRRGPWKVKKVSKEQRKRKTREARRIRKLRARK